MDNEETYLRRVIWRQCNMGGDIFTSSNMAMRRHIYVGVIWQ